MRLARSHLADKNIAEPPPMITAPLHIQIDEKGQEHMYSKAFRKGLSEDDDIPFEQQEAFCEEMHWKFKCAVYSLGDAHYTYVCGSAEHLKNFVGDIKGDLIGEPLRLIGFLFGMEEREKELRSWTEGILNEV